jgi:hypothetical protein
MKWITVNESVRPRRFISYSRRDMAALRECLGSSQVFEEGYWLDTEQIALGEDWRHTIEQAVRSCDELILFVSDHSLSSEVVAEEIALAQAHGKVICPVIVGSISDPSRIPVSHIQMIDANKYTLNELFSEEPPPLGRHSPGAVSIKTIAARHVWPMFDPAMYGRREYESIGHVLQATARTSADHSAIVLNYGLWSYHSGQSATGLKEIERYAKAADTFAGWYFMALLGPRQRALRSIPLNLAKKLRSACDRAVSLGDNLLCMLLEAFYDVCTENLSPDRLFSALRSFVAGLEQTTEIRSEFFRFAVAMEANFGEFGASEDLVLSKFEEIIS